MIITAISYPSNTLNFSQDVGDSLTSNELVKYLSIDVAQAGTDEYIEITYNGETITLLITEECLYTPIDIFYQNKEGALSSFTMFKKTTETLEVSSEDFESDRGQPNLGNHQYVTYNVQAKQKFKSNTGFIDEDNNEIIKQLSLSERVWKYEGGVFIPLRITNKPLEYKTQRNDKLINYTLDFEYAFNELNNI